MHQTRSKHQGFTIVELLIVIVVIGILAGIAVVSYGRWHRSTAVAQVKSDLNMARSALENHRNFNDSFPQDVNSLADLAQSSGVTLSGGSVDGGKTYCVDGQTSQYSDVNYYIDSMGSGVESGSCPTTSTATLTLVLDGPNTGSVAVVDGAYTQNCVKTGASSRTCDLNYLYTGSGKTLTSVTAVPDLSSDVAGLKWWDYWQCYISSGPQLGSNAYNNFVDSTYHVNFGAHTYTPQPGGACY